jgi:hypothetical protein
VLGDWKPTASKAPAEAANGTPDGSAAEANEGQDDVMKDGPADEAVRNAGRDKEDGPAEKLADVTADDVTMGSGAEGQREKGDGDGGAKVTEGGVNGGSPVDEDAGVAEDPHLDVVCKKKDSAPEGNPVAGGKVNSGQESAQTEQPDREAPADGDEKLPESGKNVAEGGAVMAEELGGGSGQKDAPESVQTPAGGQADGETAARADFTIVPMTDLDWSCIENRYVKRLLSALCFKYPRHGTAYWRVPGDCGWEWLEKVKDWVKEACDNVPEDVEDVPVETAGRRRARIDWSDDDDDMGPPRASRMKEGVAASDGEALGGAAAQPKRRRLVKKEGAPEGGDVGPEDEARARARVEAREAKEQRREEKRLARARKRAELERENGGRSAPRAWRPERKGPVKKRVRREVPELEPDSDVDMEDVMAFLAKEQGDRKVREEARRVKEEAAEKERLERIARGEEVEEETVGKKKGGRKSVPKKGGGARKRAPPKRKAGGRKKPTPAFGIDENVSDRSSDEKVSEGEKAESEVESEGDSGLAKAPVKGKQGKAKGATRRPAKTSRTAKTHQAVKDSDAGEDESDGHKAVPRKRAPAENRKGGRKAAAQMKGARRANAKKGRVKDGDSEDDQPTMDSDAGEDGLDGPSDEEKVVPRKKRAPRRRPAKRAQGAAISEQAAEKQRVSENDNSGADSDPGNGSPLKETHSPAAEESKKGSRKETEAVANGTKTDDPGADLDPRIGSPLKETRSPAAEATKKRESGKKKDDVVDKERGSESEGDVSEKKGTTSSQGLHSLGQKETLSPAAEATKKRESGKEKDDVVDKACGSENEGDVIGKKGAPNVKLAHLEDDRGAPSRKLDRGSSGSDTGSSGSSEGSDTDSESSTGSSESEIEVDKRGEMGPGKKAGVPARKGGPAEARAKQKNVPKRKSAAFEKQPTKRVAERQVGKEKAAPSKKRKGPVESDSDSSASGSGSDSSGSSSDDSSGGESEGRPAKTGPRTAGAKMCKETVKRRTKGSDVSGCGSESDASSGDSEQSGRRAGPAKKAARAGKKKGPVKRKAKGSDAFGSENGSDGSASGGESEETRPAKKAIKAGISKVKRKAKQSDISGSDESGNTGDERVNAKQTKERAARKGKLVGSKKRPAPKRARK